jgi:hypothetical protein
LLLKYQAIILITFNTKNNMKEFLLVFRRDVQSETIQISADQMQAMTKPWQDWMGSLAAQNKLSNRGNRLASEGKVVKPGNVVVNGPYVELKEALGGYIMVKASNLDEATELAKNCPILSIGGSVEVRAIVQMEN